MSENAPTERDRISDLLTVLYGRAYEDGKVDALYPDGDVTISADLEIRLSVDPDTYAEGFGQADEDLKVVDAILALRGEGEPAPALDDALRMLREAKTTLSAFAVASASKPTSSHANTAIWKLAEVEKAMTTLARPSPPSVAAEVVERLAFACRDDALNQRYGVNEQITVNRSDLRALLQAVEGKRP